MQPGASPYHRASSGYAIFRHGWRSPMTIVQEIVISIAIATLAVGGSKVATALIWLMVP